MERDVPEPQPYDPARSGGPHLPPAADGSPGVVLLVVSSSARQHEWAERAAAALAESWADQGRRILLADFALARPGLHRVLDVGNGEGVSDAFLFGSSVHRVARPVRDGRFLFMPAGTATARPEDVTSSPRWAAIVAACASVRATLVAFLPSDLPGGEALLRWASDVVLLTDGSTANHETLARGMGDRLRGILVPQTDGRAEDLLAEAGDGVGLMVDDSVTVLSPLDAWDASAVRPAMASAAADDADPWSEIESDHERIAGDDGMVPAIDVALDLGPSEAGFAGEPVTTSGADAVGIDPFAGLQPSANPLLPEPVTAEQEKEAAAIFDLSGFDGMLEETAAPQATAPVVLESEEAPIGADATPASVPHSLALTDEEASSFDLAGAVEESPPEPAPQRPARPAPRPAAERPAGPAAARAAAKPATKPYGAKGSLVGAIVMGLILIAFALAWFGIVEIPWLSGYLAARRAPAESSAPTSLPGSSVPASPVLGASLVLGSFTEPLVARLQAESLTRQRPDLLFMIAPVLVGGVAFHRLLAGPAHDSSDAVGLRSSLAALLTRENPASWRLARTPVAFYLGESDDLHSARVRAEALSRVDIPAYVLELPAPNPSGFAQVSSRRGGGTRFRVYAGAYADAHEAAYLADLLVQKGETEARLIERTGRHIE